MPRCNNMDSSPQRCKSKILAFRHENPVFPRHYASFGGRRICEASNGAMQNTRATGAEFINESLTGHSLVVAPQ
jgi:hypothetical protein